MLFAPLAGRDGRRPGRDDQSRRSPSAAASIPPAFSPGSRDAQLPWPHPRGDDRSAESSAWLQPGPIYGFIVSASLYRLLAAVRFASPVTTSNGTEIEAHDKQRSRTSSSRTRAGKPRLVRFGHEASPASGSGLPARAMPVPYQQHPPRPRVPTDLHPAARSGGRPSSAGCTEGLESVRRARISLVLKTKQRVGERGKVQRNSRRRT